MLLAHDITPDFRVRSLIRDISPGGEPPARMRAWLTPVLSLAAAGVFAWLIAAHGGEFVRAMDRAVHASWQLVAIAAALEAASIAGYVVMLHRVVAPASARLRLKDSYDIALGGSAATRLLPTAGLGGAAVTVWALRARGVRTGELAERLLAFLLLLYGVYMAALLTGGAAVASGLVRVSEGRALGIAGVALAAIVVITVLLVFAAPSPLARALGRAGHGTTGLSGAAQRAARQLPVLHAALQRAWLELRRPHPALLGAIAWWAFDLGVLVTMLHAFGATLPLPAIVLAYFLGTMLNVVPLPGSLSGGLTGCLIALGSPAAPAIAAVLAYRALAVWLPAAPGIASLARLRSSVERWRSDANCEAARPITA
jgi:uncharacterized membrane protein YbhN (UPF0104 family)